MFNHIIAQYVVSIDDVHSRLVEVLLDFHTERNTVDCRVGLNLDVPELLSYHHYCEERANKVVIDM